MEQLELTRAEKITRALAGRTQTYILKEMNKLGVYMSDADFSRCKHGNSNFTEKELKTLSKILGTQITND